jgi:protein arginine N-methyltransferase 1
MADYTIRGYAGMIGSRARLAFFHQALQRVVKPDSVVVDIGAGTGILAFIACQVGARKVYAIELSKDAVNVGREMAAANGYAQRIEFIAGSALNVSLPERADVIVSALHGWLPFFGQHFSIIIDARQRWLKPGGTLIPARDTLWATLVEMPALYTDMVQPWGENPFNLNMEPHEKYLVNTESRVYASPENVVLEPQVWATLDYATLTNHDAHAHLTWTARRAGTAHGVLVWFDCDLFEGVSFSNKPGASVIGYGHTFYPLRQPVVLTPGDVVSVKLWMNKIAPDQPARWHTDYLCTWHTHVLSNGRCKADFRQSNFLAMPLPPRPQIQSPEPTDIPVLSQRGL